jgi:osmotically-inducible protein OsmY
MTSFNGSGRSASTVLAALAAVSLVLSAAALRADEAPVQRKDSEIRKDVVDQILRYPWYTVFDSIEAGVDHGVVVLRGSVNQPYRKTDIEKRVARIAGVKGVKSEIKVQGVSSFDDRLRRELYYRIYGDDRFVQYASWADPPIRIIVDRGRITLTGYVGSPVEQRLVGLIARGTLAFAVDNQVKLESERHVEPVHKAPVQTPVPAPVQS